MRNNIVFNPDIANWVAKALVLSGAYHIAMTNDRSSWYKWKSGIVAPVYCNTRQLYSHSIARLAAISGFHTVMNSCFKEAEGILGMATAGIGWASTLAHLTDKPGGYVRSNPKKHGFDGLVEYYNFNARQVLLIDDLVASGESLSNAIKIIEDHNLEVVGVLSIVNWGFPHMRETLKGRKIVTLCSYPEIINQLELSEDARNDLLNFYEAPNTHVWTSKLFSKNSREDAA